MGIRNIASGLIGLALAGGLAWGGLSPGVGGIRPTPPGWALAPGLDSPVTSAAPSADVGRAEFRWPLDDPVVVVRAFDRPAQPWLAGHRGVDLAADVGRSIRAPADGVVTYVGFVVDRHLIVIDHGTTRSTLEPVSSPLAVGDRVEAGAVVGTITPEAAHTANSLHWGVRLPDGTYIDPAALVNPRPRAVLLE